LYGSRVDGYNTIRTQPDLIPNKNLTKPVLGVKDNRLQIKQGNEMLPGQTMRDIHGQQSNAKIELKEAVK